MAPVELNRSPLPRIIPSMLAKLMSFLLLGIVRFLTGSQARWYCGTPKAEQRSYFQDP